MNIFLSFVQPHESQAGFLTFVALIFGTDSFGTLGAFGTDILGTDMRGTDTLGTETCMVESKSEQ